MLRPPERKPCREDFGLSGAGGPSSRDDQNRIEQCIADKIRSYGIDSIDLPKPTRYWESYQTWKNQRNPSRAELEREHGYDTKHAMHLIRLMRMGLEVLQRGELCVRRHDAGELSAIRDGSLSFDELLAAAARLQHEMEQLAATTNLPRDVDRAWVDELAVALMQAPPPPSAT